MKVLLFIMCLSAVSTVARAQGAVRCPVCPATQHIPFNYSTMELPHDPNGPVDHYINNAVDGRFITANRYVTTANLHYSQFNTEPGYDYLKYWNVHHILNQRLSGALVPGTFTYAAATSLQADPGVALFVSDGSVTQTGMRVDGMDVCCTSGAGDDTEYTFSAAQPDRISGVLLGTGDVVYFKVPVPNNPAKLVTAVLWGSGSDHDFDLYMACTGRPVITPGAGYGSWSASNNEFVSPDSYCVPSGGASPYWYIAVVSYRGSGQFDLMVSQHDSDREYHLRAGTAFVADQTQVGTMRSQLLNGMRYFYGASEGRMVVRTVDLYNTGSCSSCGGAACDVCLTNDLYNADCSGGVGGRVRIGNRFWTTGEELGRAVAHEWGHCLAGLPDEYYDMGLFEYEWQCGHSMMSNPYTDVNTFCYASDHDKDSSPPGGTPNPNPSNWTTISTLFQSDVNPIPIQTPENHSFLDHSVNGSLSVVIH